MLGVNWRLLMSISLLELHHIFRKIFCGWLVGIFNATLKLLCDAALKTRSSGTLWEVGYSLKICSPLKGWYKIGNGRSSKGYLILQFEDPCHDIPLLERIQSVTKS